MILVDGARWPWRGRMWAHLVSDRSVAELHEFAHALGKRRVGFQGDHYDVDENERSRAVAMGAVAVDSRVLVRRLRDSGLRTRGGLEKWNVHHDGPVAGGAEELLARFVDARLAAGLQSGVAALPALRHDHAVALERTGECALLLRLEPGASPLDTADAAELVTEMWTHRDGDHLLVELLQRH